MARTLTNEIIDAAIEGFEAQKQRLDARILELRSMRDGGSMRDGAGNAQPSAAPGTGRRKRKFSPDALRRMREAQQRRWAKVRGEAEPSAPATSKPRKKKRRLSEAGRKAIQEALRKRWAQKRAEAGTKPANKKAARKKTASAKSAPAKTATE
jgi:hypothetical protein